MSNKLPRSIRKAQRRVNPEVSSSQSRPSSDVPDEGRLDPATARRYYLLGRAGFNRDRREWDRTQRIVPGAHALMQVLRLDPSKYDEDGRTIHKPTDELAAQLDQGLVDIREAGVRPLDDEFVSQYTGFRDTLVRESVEIHSPQGQTQFDDVA